MKKTQLVPFETLIHAFVGAMLAPDEYEVRLISGDRNLVAEVHVTSSPAKGLLIGAKGETITALRHLVHRIGKRASPPVTTWVEVIAPEETA